MKEIFGMEGTELEQTTHDHRDMLGYDIGIALLKTRQEPGLSIAQVAKVINLAWQKEEVEALVKELNKELHG